MPWSLRVASRRVCLACGVSSRSHLVVKVCISMRRGVCLLMRFMLSLVGKGQMRALHPLNGCRAGTENGAKEDAPRRCQAGTHKEYLGMGFELGSVGVRVKVEACRQKRKMKMSHWLRDWPMWCWGNGV
jgi:hypothetical protein